MNNDNINKKYTALAYEVEQESNCYPILFEFKSWLFVVSGYLFLYAMDFGVGFGMCVIFSGWTLFSSNHLTSNDILEFYGYAAIVIAVFSVLELSRLAGMAAPKGYRLKPFDYPQLFASLLKIDKQSGTVKIDKVLLTHGHKIEVFQMPRFFGIRRNSTILSIGFELFLIMSPLEMNALLVQISRSLSDRRNTYLRMGNMVIRLLNVLSLWFNKSRFLQKPAIRIDQYAAVVTIYTAVVSRAITIAADKAAAKESGVSCLVEALLKQSLLTRYLNQHFWLPIEELINVLPEPVVSPYRQLTNWLPQQPVTHKDLSVVMGQLYAETPIPWDNQPGLKERLAALDAESLVTLNFHHSAAEGLFGRRYDKVMADMDLDWWYKFEPIWRKYYLEHQAQQAAQTSEAGVAASQQS